MSPRGQTIHNVLRKIERIKDELEAIEDQLQVEGYPEQASGVSWALLQIRGTLQELRRYEQIRKEMKLI